MPAFVANSNSLRVLVSMPAAALITITAVSATDIDLTAGPIKSGEPGVSIMLINLPAYSVCTIAEEME